MVVFSKAMRIRFYTFIIYKNSRFILKDGKRKNCEKLLNLILNLDVDNFIEFEKKQSKLET